MSRSTGRDGFIANEATMLIVNVYCPIDAFHLLRELYCVVSLV